MLKLRGLLLQSSPIVSSSFLGEMPGLFHGLFICSSREVLNMPMVSKYCLALAQSCSESQSRCHFSLHWCVLYLILCYISCCFNNICLVMTLDFSFAVFKPIFFLLQPIFFIVDF